MQYILIYIQRDATLHSLFYLETALHVSGGTTTHHQERKQLYVRYLVFVTTLLLPAAIVEELERCSNSSMIAAGRLVQTCTCMYKSVQVFLRMNTWMFETCRRQYN